MLYPHSVQPHFFGGNSGQFSRIRLSWPSYSFTPLSVIPSQEQKARSVATFSGTLSRRVSRPGSGMLAGLIYCMMC